MSWPSIIRIIIVSIAIAPWATSATAQETAEPVPKVESAEMQIFGPQGGPAARANRRPERQRGQQLPQRANGQRLKGSSNKNGLPGKKTDVNVELPQDAKKPVLVVDSVGGFRMQLPEGFQPTPMLQIFPDGRILTGRKSPLVKEVEGQIDLVELQALLVFIAEDCRFFDITSENLKSELEAKRTFKIMDAGTTEFTVELKDHSNSIEVYALPQVAGKFADVPSVASVIAIASRCRRLISLTRLGSEEEAIAAIQTVNKSLATQAPNAPAFTREKLQYAEQFVDGRRSATFIQEFVDNGQTMLAYATYQLDAKGNASVNLNITQQRGQ